MTPEEDATRPLRVLALVTLPTLGGGNRLRIEQYHDLLLAHGIDLQVSAFFDDATYGILYEPGRTMRKGMAVLRGVLLRLHDLARIRAYDLVIVYREAAPIGPPLLEQAIARIGVPFVFDFDDAIWLAPVHPANQRWAWLRRPSRVARAARLARAVIVGNEYLAQSARRWNRDVTIIPTAVDTDRHRPGLAHRPSRPKVIGWVGSSTTAPYLDLIDEPLGRLARRRADVLLRVVGGRHPHPAIPVDARPYRLEQEPADVSTFHVGVLPEPDDAWTRGKGAFKALLYMAAAIPVVASKVGVNPDVIEHGRTGFCVDGATEWVDALTRLIDDERLSRELGERGRERVERLFSLKVQGPRLAEVIFRAAGR